MLARPAVCGHPTGMILTRAPSRAPFTLAVKRNIERFPDRFMFRLVESEMRELVTNCDRFETLKHSGVPMYAFTEQGVAMLSAVLRSKIAIDVSIRIMDAFVAMRRFAYDHAGLVQRVGAIELKQLETDKRIDTVFDALDRGNLLPSGILPAESEFDSTTSTTDFSLSKLPRPSRRFLHHPRREGDCEAAGNGAISAVGE